MQTKWLVKKGQARILLLFLGWSGNARTANNFRPEGYDMLAVYDYRDLDDFSAILQALAAYPERILLAWSFGVWVAEFLAPELPSFHRHIAINGTPRPIDDRYGIPERIFRITLKGIEREGVEKFCQNMYGRPAADDELPDRTLEELIGELRSLSRCNTLPSPETLPWDHALISERDAIFPPENMLAYWRMRHVPVFRWETGRHYPFSETGTKIVEQLLNR